VFIKIDPDDGRPVYEQIAGAIRELIVRRELTEGDVLPPVRQVAADLGVNLNTIAAAYRVLQDEGLLAIRHGSGAVVTSRTASGVSEGALRISLRTALTQLLLAGLPKAHIMNMVAEELRGLLEGAAK
jgi:GntR family transcriptional regulator